MAEEDGAPVGVVVGMVVLLEIILVHGVWSGGGCGGGTRTVDGGRGIDKVPRDGGGTLRSPHLSSYAVHKLQYVV